MDKSQKDLHDRILDSCIRHDLSYEQPVFYNRLVFYLKTLREWQELIAERKKKDIDYALIETHTIIEMNEDMEGCGGEQLVELWESALGIQYGVDYSYVLEENRTTPILRHFL